LNYPLDVRSQRSKTAVESILKIHKEGALEMNINELFASYIHMFMNRLFKTKNRLHEMIAYDFLHRYYIATLSKQKKVQGSK